MRVLALIAMLVAIAPAAASVPRDTADPPLPATIVFSEDFEGADGLVTNEFAFRNPDHPQALISPRWTMTSGSLLQRDGYGWTGNIDSDTPDVASEASTGSAVFRALANTKVDGRTEIVLDVLPLAFSDVAPDDWDGFHILVRYQSEQEFYAVSAMRRDGTIVIKRKDPGGPSNGGTYTTLASTNLPMALGGWHRVGVEVVDVPGGVRITLSIDELPVLETLDIGETGEPLVGTSQLSIRGDDLEFQFDNVIVRSG